MQIRVICIYHRRHRHQPMNTSHMNTFTSMQKGNIPNKNKHPENSHLSFWICCQHKSDFALWSFIAGEFLKWMYFEHKLKVSEPQKSLQYSTKLRLLPEEPQLFIYHCLRYYSSVLNNCFTVFNSIFLIPNLRVCFCSNN